MSAKEPEVGAARAWTAKELGGPCTENESNPVIGATVATVIEGNGDRVGLTIINLGTNNLFVALASNVGSTNGILIGANGGLLTVSVRDDFTLPSRKWYGISPGGNTNVYVLEEVRNKMSNQ